MTLRIGKHFTLPLELVTSTQAILARKRSGKSYTASVEAEELLAHKQQVVVFDPTSAWHGLRSSADGQGEGFAIVVFGGDQHERWHFVGARVQHRNCENPTLAIPPRPAEPRLVEVQEL